MSSDHKRDDFYNYQWPPDPKFDTRWHPKLLDQFDWTDSEEIFEEPERTPAVIVWVSWMLIAGCVVGVIVCVWGM